MRECNNKCFGAGAGDCDKCQKEDCEIREKKQLESPQGEVVQLPIKHKEKEDIA